MKLHLSKHLSNQELSRLFLFIAGVLEVQDTNPYKVAAYRNSAATIATLSSELKHIYADPEHNFDDLPSIGESISEKLDELFKTSDIKAFQKYVKNIPNGTYQLSQVHGIGVKTAFALAKAFKLPGSDKALEIILDKAKHGQIRKLENFGEKSEADLIAAIQAHVNKKRMSYKVAKTLSDKIIGQLKSCSSITKLESLGSLRRKSKSIGDIDIGLVTNDMGSVKSCVKKMKNVKEVLVAGDNLMSVVLKNGIQVDLKASPAGEWGSFIQHFTGGKEHNIKLRQYALKKGLSLSEHGIKHKGKLLKFSSEQEFYKYLGLKYIPPEERIGGSEIEEYRL